MPQTDPDIVARETLRLIGSDPQNWVPDRDDVDHNVVVVGGGQSGTAFAFALRRAGVGKVSVIDAAPDNAGAGVWRTSARMHKLRTPKNLQWRLEEGESFHTEIVTKGKVLYEKSHSGMGAKSRGRLSRRPATRQRRRAVS